VGGDAQSRSRSNSKKSKKNTSHKASVLHSLRDQNGLLSGKVNPSGGFEKDSKNKKTAIKSLVVDPNVNKNDQQPLYS
jgi:hypothetical protein